MVKRRSNGRDTGDKSYEEFDYIGAEKYYNKAIELDSAGVKLLFKHAECLRLMHDYQGAIKAYKRVIKEDQFSEALPAQFWLADMQKSLGLYDEARVNFKKFYKDYKRLPYFSRMAKQEIKSCAFAKRFSLDTAKVIIENAGKQINTYNSEFSPVVINDSVIYYSSLVPEKKGPGNTVKDDNYVIRIYKAEYKDSIWKTAGLVEDLPLNSEDFHSANGCFSKDRNRFYFSRCSGYMNCTVYYTQKESGKWTEPVPVPEINLEGYTTTQPMLANVDGKEVLFFTSNRPRGKGKMDIYYSVVKNNGQVYSKPRNMGRKINSIEDEIAPYYDEKEKALYFSSKWFYGLGGFDIFKVAGGLKPKQTPDNLGSGINSSFNDYYYTPLHERESAFFVSNRPGSITNKNASCCNDIYVAHNPKEPKPDYITLEELNKYLPVTLYFHNDEPGPKSWDTVVTETYLESYEKYTALTDKYKKEYSGGLTGEEQMQAVRDIEDFFSGYVDKGVDDLELFTELLIKELQKGQKIEITVKGYASPLAKTDYNVNLTYRRISSMINYLLTFDEGVYQPYIRNMSEDGGSLSFVKIPFGEYTAENSVSDNPNDQKNSVYSKKAALERKIEIISVQQAFKDSIFAEISFIKEISDFGQVPEGDSLVQEFKFRNTGKKDLIINSVESDCECVSASYPKQHLRPGQEGEIIVTFNTTGIKGKQVKNIVVDSNGSTKPKILSITAEINPQ